MTIHSELIEPAHVAKSLGDLYRRRGDQRYDELVTQTEHALQCASLALATGADNATIVAALLHDIGHLLIPNEHANEADRHHQSVGARFLSHWFGDDVVEPIEHHVAAKRYLCALEPEYLATLSPASVRSLRLQGGPMNNEEFLAFQRIRRYQVAIELRRWDDLAKVPNAPTAPFAVFESIIEAVLCRP